MAYDSGEVPELGDHVRHISGRPGVITSVYLNQGNLRGEDQVSVKWDDGGVGIGMALAREFIFVSQGNESTSRDGYAFLAQCPICDERRSVSCSRSQAKTGEPVKVAAIVCNHSWTLTPEQSKKVVVQLSEIIS